MSKLYPAAHDLGDLEADVHAQGTPAIPAYAAEEPRLLVTADEYRVHAEALRHFRSLLEAYADLHEPYQDVRGHERLAASPGADLRLSELRAELNDLAPRAGAALFVYGSSVNRHRPGTAGYAPMNPIPTWATAFTPDPILGLDVLVDLMDQGIGFLEMQTQKAAAAEGIVISHAPTVVSSPDEVHRPEEMRRSEEARRPADNSWQLPRPTPQYYVGLASGIGVCAVVALMAKILGIG